MSYNINGLGYGSRNEALTALVADYVREAASDSSYQAESLLNDIDTPDDMEMGMSLEMGPCEEPTDVYELADHIQTHKADIIMATS